MTVTIASDRRRLLAGATGLLAAAATHSALVTPWLNFLVREPPEFDWLNTTSALERWYSTFQSSLIMAVVISPLIAWIVVSSERKGPASFRSALKLGVVGALPFACFAWLGANSPFDCVYNCEPSRLRDLIVIGSVITAGLSGATIAWLVRHAIPKRAG